ncbi:MAG: Asp-tRNA(Asn)/Glu-tRNA(Gln) amidotransferase GatCAB subunit B, partial [Polaromonas sp.]|nr:Asp-tRNA(Asn)/Glu-tRNA(Gln) amidotransferase GatCAB subunit B [Polaromonas sp.]
ICDGNMQEGSFRCDANVSVRKPGEPLGTRREIKNLNSFKFMQQAMDFEIRWQIEQIEDGHAIQQATVLFDQDTGETRSMRSKEDAADYRYFPDPDLPPLVIGRDWVEQVRKDMVKLPRELASEFVSKYSLSDYDASLMTQSMGTMACFQVAVDAGGPPKLVSNWIMGELARHLNANDIASQHSHVNGLHLADLTRRIDSGVISNSAAKKVFEVLWNKDGHNVDEIIARLGLAQMNDSSELEKIIDDVLAANAKNVEEIRAGNAKAMNALVGQAMKATKGKANPAQVNELLKKKIG